MMAQASLPSRVLRYALLDPIEDARNILHRLQSNEMFQRYLRERWLHALPLVAGVAIGGLALSGGAMVYIMRSHSFLALMATIVVAPVVLFGSLFVQAYVLLSWLEGRALAKLREQRRASERGPFARWVARRFRLDLGPAPAVPWIPALAFLVLPAAMLAAVGAQLAAGLAVFLAVGAIVYARRDPVSGVRGVGVAPGDAADLDFASPAPGSGGGNRTRSIHSVAQSGLRTVRSAARSGLRTAGSLVQLALLNLLPLVEYCALGYGVFAVVAGRKSASEQDVALGIALIGAAFLLGGLAAIVTKRMSFRFFGNLRTGYAGAPLIVGVMQLILGGLALAAAHALATHIWQARLDALLSNPWPLLVPLGLLLICAGLLLVRRSSDRVGFLGTVLYILPKTLAGLALLSAGAAILAGGAWNLYDPQAFRSFLSLVPDEYMNLLVNGWSTAIALLR